MSLGAAIITYRSLTPFRKSVIAATLVVLPVLGSALTSYYMRLTLERTFQVQLAIVIILFFVYALARRYVELRCELLDKIDERQRNALAQTYVSLDEAIATDMRRLHNAIDHCERTGAANGAELIKVVFGSLDHIQILIDALYEVVQGQFGQPGSLLDEIDFEVTFMTRSYVDQEITIYASQNRDHRAPRSMLLREQDKHIYSSTVTAEIYREVRPESHIIEDTAKEDYKPVYTGQLDRIKSSVVYPVLSDKSELLGTIVIHCNRNGFFKRSEGKFWSKLIEPYAKRLAFEKMKFDYLLRADLPQLARSISVATLKPDR